MTDSKKRTTLGVKIDLGTRDRLRSLGEKRDRTTHWLVREAIARYLVDEEQYEQERAEDEARWRDYMESGRFVSSEEVSDRMRKWSRLAAKRIAEEP